MDNNPKNHVKTVSLGSLGHVLVSELEFESPQIFAKYPSSVMVACPGGGNAPDGGPTMDDDAGCMVPHTV